MERGKTNEESTRRGLLLCSLASLTAEGLARRFTVLCAGWFLSEALEQASRLFYMQVGFDACSRGKGSETSALCQQTRRAPFLHRRMMLAQMSCVCFAFLLIRSAPVLILQLYVNPTAKGEVVWVTCNKKSMVAPALDKPKPSLLFD